MHIYTNNKVTRIYNVIGKIRGATEPGKNNGQSDLECIDMQVLQTAINGHQSLCLM